MDSRREADLLVNLRVLLQHLVGCGTVRLVEYLIDPPVVEQIYGDYANRVAELSPKTRSF
jgi:hypothetical protein